jgi:L-fucose mutarotase
MLRTRLLHPEILQALAMSGHFSQVMIADGNYPFVSRSHSETRRVYLNLAPGMVRTTDVLDVLAETIPIQGALMMRVPDGQEAPIVGEYRARLPAAVEIEYAERQAFYDRVSSSTTSLLIATGETRRFANLLLTVGVVKLETSETY